MPYSTNPVADADLNEQAAYANTAAHDAELTSAVAEIREAFAAYFNGKPGIYLPYVSIRNGREEILGKPAATAAWECSDYDETRAALAALLTGSGTVEQMREAIVCRYIYNNVADLVEMRSGLYVPEPSGMLKHISDMAVAA